MAKAGDVIENPITRERITFLKTTRETNGELLRFEYVVPPRFFIPEHFHPRQVEHHEVLSGTLRGRVGGRREATEKVKRWSARRTYLTHGRTPAATRSCTS